jgi:choline dehydrogenase
MRESTYDYVIVGAGSAGCVLASRLSMQPEVSVLLLEAGGRDSNPYIHMPAGIAKLVGNRDVDWDYYTEAEPELHGRRLYWPRGRVLGGSSSINAMCYTRGHPRDYDEWADLGNRGWDYAAVLPYFRKAEDQANGPSEHHGVGGPLHVEDLKFRNPLSSVFVEAATAIGLPRNNDFNGAVQEGIGFYQVTQRDGRRCSAAVAYLHPVRGRENLRVSTRSLAERILFRGSRASAVEFRCGGALRVAYANREIILAAGSVASPQLLMLSGIGPADELRALGITVIADLPEVGCNLQDHLDFCTLAKCRQPITYDFSSWREIGVGLRYYLTHSGPGVSNVAEAGGFVRTQRAVDERPDVQLHFVPAQLDDHGRNRLPGHGFTVHACVLRPRSRGRIALRTARPEDPPRIHARYLAEAFDLEALLEGLRISREILSAAPFAPFRGPEVLPGDGVTARKDVEEVVRRKAETIYHPVGTCRMGIDAGAVVDPQLRVRGVDGLRVADASVMPRLIGGNTNAPVIMIAEKAAEWIAADSSGQRAVR